MIVERTIRVRGNDDEIDFIDVNVCNDTNAMRVVSPVYHAGIDVCTLIKRVSKVYIPNVGWVETNMCNMMEAIGNV